MTSIPNSTGATEIELIFGSKMVGNQSEKVVHWFLQANKIAKTDVALATTVYLQCLMAEPNNVEYVQAFLNSLNRRKPSLRAGKSLAWRRSFREKDWKTVLSIGWDRLLQNPRNVSTFLGLATACEHLHYNETELCYLKRALELKPADAGVNEHCARSLARMGQFDQAIVCWARLEQVSRKRDEARRMIAILNVQKSDFSRSGATHHPDVPVVTERNAGDSEFDVQPSDAVPPSGYQSRPTTMIRKAKTATHEATSSKKGVKQNPTPHGRVPWLELGLLWGLVAFVVQIIPGAMELMWERLQSTFVMINVGVLLSLCAIRYFSHSHGQNDSGSEC